MTLIVDSNIIFAGLLRDSITRQLLVNPPFALCAPETVLKEIRKYEEEIVKRAGLTGAEFEILFSLITDGIQIIEKERYAHKIKDAEKLVGNLDKGDLPFLALALSMPNDGIWTENARHFRQKQVRIWTTKELTQQL